MRCISIRTDSIRVAHTGTLILVAFPKLLLYQFYQFYAFSRLLLAKAARLQLTLL